MDKNSEIKKHLPNLVRDLITRLRKFVTRLQQKKNNIREKEKTWPKTVEEAVNMILLVLNETDKERIRNTPKAMDMIGEYHFSLGMWIRNEFGLRGGNDELLRSCGVERTNDYEYPDYASAEILGALWQELHRPSSNEEARPVKYLSIYELMNDEMHDIQESKPCIDEVTQDPENETSLL